MTHRPPKSAKSSRKPYRFSTFTNRIATPLRGLITPKYQSPDQQQQLGQGDQRRCRICQRRKRLPALAQRLSKRMRQLAKPKHVRIKFKPRKWRLCRCACATVIRPGECSARLGEMALPQVRKLVSAKSEFRPVVSPKQVGNFDKNIQLSLRTVYSRMANVALPEPREPTKPWSPKEWESHNDWARTHAKPKTPPSETPIARESRPINHLHVDTMAKPRWTVPMYVDPGTKVSDPMHPIKPSVLTFVMTPRLELLTKPFKTPEPDDEFEAYENPHDVPRDYAKITGTGLNALAEPRPRSKSKRFQRGDNASVVFAVSKLAMQAKPSEYTKKLAEPRKDMQTGPKPNPYGVSKAAVSKKPVPKPKEEIYAKLATPKKRD